MRHLVRDHIGRSCSRCSLRVSGHIMRECPITKDCSLNTIRTESSATNLSTQIFMARNAFKVSRLLVSLCLSILHSRTSEAGHPSLRRKRQTLSVQLAAASIRRRLCRCSSRSRVSARAKHKILFYAAKKSATYNLSKQDNPRPSTS